MDRFKNLALFTRIVQWLCYLGIGFILYVLVCTVTKLWQGGEI